jgi:hypothetical protein
MMTSISISLSIKMHLHIKAFAVEISKGMPYSYTELVINE